MYEMAAVTVPNEESKIVWKQIDPPAELGSGESISSSDFSTSAWTEQYSLLPSTSENSTDHREASLCELGAWIDSECFRAITLSFSLVAGNRH
jgi:hypothetical protein